MSTIETTNDDDLTTEEWITAHPEVTAAAPAWADTIDATEDGFQVGLSYDRDFGSVEIGMAASWRDGKVTTKDPGVYVYFSANEAAVTPESLRAYAAQFAAAADALESSGRTLRRSPDVDEALRERDI